jgi:integrase/recombinase XerD
MKISQIWGDFIQYKILDEGRSLATISKYEDCRKRFVGLVGDMEVEQISRLTFWEVKTRLSKLSPARVNSILMCIRTLLRYCENEGMEVFDPSKVKPIKEVVDKEVVFLTNEEIRMFFNEMDLNNIHHLRMRTLCEVILDTGARINEALSLDRASIKKEKTEEGTMTYAKIIGKGNKERRLIFGGRSMFWIEQYLNRREDSHPALFVTHCEARRLKPNAGTKDWGVLARKAGIDKKVSPHILRHTAFTNAHKHGVDIQIIKEWAGHARVDTTCRYYSHVDHVDIMKAKQQVNYDD